MQNQQLSKNALFAFIHLICLITPFLIIKIFFNDCACHYAVAIFIDFAIVMFTTPIVDIIFMGYCEIFNTSGKFS